MPGACECVVHFEMSVSSHIGFWLRAPRAMLAQAPRCNARNVPSVRQEGPDGELFFGAQ